jgi:hypothetical protein
MTKDEIAVWNRAAMQAGGPSPREGDRMLSALLLVHGLVMNGGVMHGVQAVMETELQAACAGYRYFGFAKVAALLEAARKEEWTEDNEEPFDVAYGRLIDDEAIGASFVRRMAEDRGLFAP